MIKHSLKYRNVDSTADINSRLSKLVQPGIITGGELLPVPGQLKYDIQPWKLVSSSGMVVEETGDVYRFAVPPGQTTIAAVRVAYQANDVPIVAYTILEEAAFGSLPNQSEYLIFAALKVPSSASIALSSYVEYDVKTSVDSIGRDYFRGQFSTSSALPNSKDSRPSDWAIINDGVNAPSIWIFGGSTWINVTNVISLSSDLGLHRLNHFANEKHLTDNEKLAVVGSSGTAVGNTNKLVDAADPRLPTQNENNALTGSNGSPSATNPFITSSHPIALPTEKSYLITPPVTSVKMESVDGPFYVGNGGLSSAERYFSVYVLDGNREFLTVGGNRIAIDLYTDAGMTTPLIPATNPNVEHGFYTGSLWVGFSTIVDAQFTILYGKKSTVGSISAGGLLNRTPADAQISSDTIKTVENIKGAKWDTPLLNREQNVNLWQSLLSTRQYLSSALNTDYVLTDVEKVNSIPEYQGKFIKNNGIPVEFSYENSPAVTFTYNPISGAVTYASVFDLTGVVPGDIFYDGNATEFVVISVGPGVRTISILTRDNLIPSTINTSLSSPLAGSISRDHNPLGINLSDLRPVGRKEQILVKELENTPNFFEPRTGNIGRFVRTPIKTPFYTDKRMSFFGTFKTEGTGESSRVVSTNSGYIYITGFFTNAYLLVDTRPDSPDIEVQVDGFYTPGSVISLSNAGKSSNIGTTLDRQREKIKLASGLSPRVPHTIVIKVLDSAGVFYMHGCELVNFDISHLILPGYGFVQTDLFENSSIYSLPAVQTGFGGRGGVEYAAVNRNLVVSRTLLDLEDFDGNSDAPTGVANDANTSLVVTGGTVKFDTFYKTHDVVRLIGTSTENTRILSSVSTATHTAYFYSALSFPTSQPVSAVHIGSVGATRKDQREFARYSVRDLGVGDDTDFTSISGSKVDRYFASDYGVTVAAREIAFDTTGIDGADLAIVIDSTSKLVIKAVCSSLALILTNPGSVNLDISIDGSDSVQFTSAGSGLRLFNVLANGRYQTHEIVISNSAATNLIVAGIALFEPLPAKIDGLPLYQRNILAYNRLTKDPYSVTPIGGVAFDPVSGGGLLVNASVTDDWAIIGFPASPTGKTVRAESFGSYFEYTFTGTAIAIEYLANSDNGMAKVYLNGVLLSSTNFPSLYRLGVSNAGTVDMYGPSSTRKIFMVSNLDSLIQEYTIRIEVPEAVVSNKHVSSSGWAVTITNIWEVNSNGTMAVTPEFSFDGKPMGLSDIRDLRILDSGSLTRFDVTATRTSVNQTRSGRIQLPNSATELNITFGEPFTDNKYTVVCNFTNTIDADPMFQPVSVSSKLGAGNALGSDGFKAKWNNPLDSGNYVLNYIAILDV